LFNTVDNLDQIYITDRDKGRILCYSADGKLIKSFGGFGSNGYVLNNPHYIVINRTGDIVLNDIVKNSICIKVLNKKSGDSPVGETEIQHGEINFSPTGPKRLKLVRELVSSSSKADILLAIFSVMCSFVLSNCLYI
jgi:hypothetical protein